MILLEHNLYSGVVVVVVKFEIKVDIGKCRQLLEQDWEVWDTVETFVCFVPIHYPFDIKSPI